MVVPPPRLCTDNGVMVAWAAVESLRLGIAHDPEGQQVKARWPLGVAVPGTTLPGAVTVEVTPLIETFGERSRGIYAQSVGGGGGNGGFAVQVAGGYGVSASIAVGGSGGSGGEGGTVDINGDVTVRTNGDYSEGIFAQSVGGGGGNGGGGSGGGGVVVEINEVY